MRVGGHVGQVVRRARCCRRRSWRSRAAARSTSPSTGDLGGQPDVAVVEPDHEEAAVDQALTELVGPGDHLGAQAHDQQQGRVGRDRPWSRTRSRCRSRRCAWRPWSAVLTVRSRSGRPRLPTAVVEPTTPTSSPERRPYRSIRSPATSVPGRWLAPADRTGRGPQATQPARRRLPVLPGRHRGPRCPTRCAAFPNRWPSMPGERVRGRALHARPRRQLRLPRLDQAAAVVDLWAERSAAPRRPARRRLRAGVREPGSRGRAPPSAIPTVRSTGSTVVPPRAARRAGPGDGRSPALGPTAPGDRLVSRSGSWRAWVPWAAGWPYSLVVAPEQPVPDLPSLDAGRAPTLADDARRRPRPPRPALRRAHAVHAVVPPAPLRRPRRGPTPGCTPTSPRCCGRRPRPGSWPAASWAAACCSTRSIPSTRPGPCARHDRPGPDRGTTDQSRGAGCPGGST